MTFNLKGLAATQERVQRRHELVERVEEGMLLPGQAQEEADQQGLGALERFADKNRFPVAHEPVWSPVMAMAWMFWRDYGLVTDFYDPYRKSCLVWRTVPREQNVPGRPPLRPLPERWYLGAMQVASLSGLKIVADQENRAGRFSYFPEFTKGKAEFFTALYGGKITATGIRATTGEHERIESFRWAVLDFVEPGRPLANDSSSGGLRNFRFVEKHKPDEVYYSDVHLSRSDIEREWPAFMEKEAIAAVSSGNLPAELSGRRGRPPLYNWPQFHTEAIRILEDEGGFSPDTVDPNWNQAVLEARMTAWCRTKWKREPAESTIREHVVRAHIDFQARRKGR